jgi:ABC-type amino acid transport system permease subunit
LLAASPLKGEIMKNIPFVIWMLGFYVVTMIDRYINPPVEASPAIMAIVGLVFFAMWLGIGYGLYEGDDK